MRILLLLLIGLGLSRNAVAEETDEVAKQYYAACRTITESRHKSLLKHLPEMKRNLAKINRSRIDTGLQFAKVFPNGVVVYPSVSAKQKAVDRYTSELKQAEDDLAKAKAGELFVYAAFPTPLKFGGVGKLPYSIVVEQRVSDNSARVSIAGETCFLDGLDFSKAVDGTDIQTDLILEVASTRTYKTVAGASRTEFVVKPFDMKRLEKAMAP